MRLHGALESSPVNKDTKGTFLGVLVIRVSVIQYDVSELYEKKSRTTNLWI